jgi:Ca2+/Na+ antiporter
MIEVFWDVPHYVHIIIAILTLVVMGIVSVDNKGKFDSSVIVPTIVIFIAMTFLWQIALVVALGVGICYIPYQVGIFVKKEYVSWNTESKASSEARNLISKNLSKPDSGKIVEITNSGKEEKTSNKK